MSAQIVPFPTANAEPASIKTLIEIAQIIADKNGVPALAPLMLIQAGELLKSRNNARGQGGEPN